MFCFAVIFFVHVFYFFFFNDTATTEIYTLSLHDALPIYSVSGVSVSGISSFVVTITAGMAMTEADSRCPAICGNNPVRKATYIPRVLDATVAMPVPSVVSSSDLVILARYGRITRADSTPTKMLAAPHNDSAPLVPIGRWKILAKTRTTICNTRR